jgi:exopolysaccharide biosynthesis polyprenyl glycosylphosphotransferase
MFLNIAFRVVDALLPMAVLWCLHGLFASAAFYPVYFVLGLLAGLGWWLAIETVGGYKLAFHYSIARKLKNVVKPWLFVLVVLSGIYFLLGWVEQLSRMVILLWAGLVPLAGFALKYWMKRLAIRWEREKPCLVMVGEAYAFTDSDLERLRRQGVRLEVWMPDKGGLTEYVQACAAKRVVLNFKEQVCDALVRELTHLELSGVKLLSMNRFSENYLRKCFIPYDVRGVDYLDDIQPLNATQRAAKRAFDYFAVLSLLLVAWPVMLYARARIKKESPGPVIFRQMRVGEQVRSFEAMKFRSMHVDSHFDPYTQKEDARIFPFGRWMRKTRIDELPQLFNVLKGEMHLVGPRTEWSILVEKYEQEIPFYHLRHLVKPGITGWAQVIYPYGANTEDARQKLMYDLYYIKHWSIWLELETLLRTVLVVLGRKGI